MMSLKPTYNYFSDVEVLKSWTWDKDYMLLKGQVASSQIAEFYVCMEAGNPLKKRITGWSYTFKIPFGYEREIK